MKKITEILCNGDVVYRRDYGSPEALELIREVKKCQDRDSIFSPYSVRTVGENDMDDSIFEGNTIPKPEDFDINRIDFNTLFHRLWTACVGTGEYDKQAWKSISKHGKA